MPPLVGPQRVVVAHPVAGEGAQRPVVHAQRDRDLEARLRQPQALEGVVGDLDDRRGGVQSRAGAGEDRGGGVLLGFVGGGAHGGGPTRERPRTAPVLPRGGVCVTHAPPVRPRRPDRRPARPARRRLGRHAVVPGGRRRLERALHRRAGRHDAARRRAAAEGRDREDAGRPLDRPVLQPLGPDRPRRPGRGHELRPGRRRRPAAVGSLQGLRRGHASSCSAATRT